MPDFKTIADFRKDNGEAIRRVCREFVELSRQVGLFTEGVVAIDCPTMGRPGSSLRSLTEVRGHLVPAV